MSPIAWCITCYSCHSYTIVRSDDEAVELDKHRALAKAKERGWVIKITRNIEGAWEKILCPSCKHKGE